MSGCRAVLCYAVLCYASLTCLSLQDGPPVGWRKVTICSERDPPFISPPVRQAGPRDQSSVTRPSCWTFQQPPPPTKHPLPFFRLLFQPTFLSQHLSPHENVPVFASVSDLWGQSLTTSIFSFPFPFSLSLFFFFFSGSPLIFGGWGWRRGSGWRVVEEREDGNWRCGGRASTSASLRDCSHGERGFQILIDSP